MIYTQSVLLILFALFIEVATFTCHHYHHMCVLECPSLIFHANGYLTLNQQKGCPIFFNNHYGN